MCCGVSYKCKLSRSVSCSGGSWGKAGGGGEGAPFSWAKKEQITKVRKAGRESKPRPRPLPPYFNVWMHHYLVTYCFPTQAEYYPF